jgi:hypothetical protein
MSPRDSKKSTKKQLYGPTVQYPDGTVVPGAPLDTDNILVEFEKLDADARSSFLCVLAHDLTVAIRAVIFDPPVTEGGLDRVKSINEALHQLTTCINPRKRRSAHDEAMLIRDIIQDAFTYGFDWAVGHALASASGSATFNANNSVAAT